MKSNFEVYLEKYCKQHNLTSEEAIKFKLVQEVKKYYESDQKGGFDENLKIHH